MQYCFALFSTESLVIAAETSTCFICSAFSSLEVQDRRQLIFDLVNIYLVGRGWCYQVVSPTSNTRSPNLKFFLLVSKFSIIM